MEYAPSNADDSIIEDRETSRLGPASAALRKDGVETTLTSRSSFSDEGKRLSVSSLYSLASARGIPSSAASASSEGGISRSVSGIIMASNKGLGPAPGHSESGLSNVTVTTSSSAQVSVGSSHQLAPRESGHPNPLDNVKRNPPPRSDPSSSSPRPQPPTRSRSRAKRRFSGSTSVTSHSPSSERGIHHGHKEKEEARPAPLGIIGVCALDSKARSKPSRNILNRLVANREFDVVVFGDKTILDEGTTMPACLQPVGWQLMSF
jgi:inositol-hexakisphosphate/diphosphoinositol-pentakisphosphate 1-kinase